MAAAVLQIRDTDGEPIGIGFLVKDDLALTCAHVVTAALGTNHDAEPPDGARISVDLPLLSASGVPATVPASIEHWIRPEPSGTGDMAVLRLTAPLSGARPIRLIEAREVWEHPARAYGLPALRPGGVWHSGVLRDRLANGLVQVVLADKGHRVSRGFSGSPVWDDELGGAVGMIVEAESGEPPVSYLIPTQRLTMAWPSHLGKLPTRSAPRRGGPRPHTLSSRAMAVILASTAVVGAGVSALIGSMNDNASAAPPTSAAPSASAVPPTTGPSAPTSSASQSSIAPTPKTTPSQELNSPTHQASPTPQSASPTGTPPRSVTGTNSASIYPGYTQTVTVRWNPQSDATSFQIHYTTTGSAQHKSVDKITSTKGTSYEFIAYQGETSCFYIRAVNRYGASAWDTDGNHCFNV
ncbi:trypsin-like peptidase domain-containing protein [Streptomyces sp. NPDC001401]|uniref:trypsin-like peptidase domain-containing protein n=1 Tax=Streptomyces sp. NPDC001401 TaxID=3364570 RepID=UPI0036BF9062